MKAAFVVVALLAVTSCNAVSGPDDEDLDHAQLLAALRGRGLPAQSAGQVSQPFFAVPGRLIAVESDQVQVFEYADERSAATDAARVSPDGGSVGGTQILWIAPPHFYRRGRLLVLYVGSRADIRAVLEQVLGPQFAGRSA